MRPFLVAPILLIATAIASCSDNEAGPPPAAEPTATTVPAATPTATAPLPTPTATPTPDTARFRQPGPFSAGITTIVFEDSSRPTMANGPAPGLPVRRLVTEIWYPSDAPRGGDPVRDASVASGAAPYPLVVHSHGFSSTRTEPAYLARHLASHGYIVVSPDFPLTNIAAPGGPNLLDVVNQPGDVSFLIDRMLEKSATAEDAFAGAVDPDRIALTGLSLGGMTTLLATFHRDLRDPRVRAAAEFAGPACFFDRNFFSSPAVPLLVLFGDIDAIVPYEENGVHAWQLAQPPKYLLTMLDGSHTAFADIASTLFEQLDNPDEVGCATLTGTGVTDEDESDSALLELLGGAEAGVVPGTCPPACAAEGPLARSMRPSRQQALTIMAVHSFLEAYLNADRDALWFLEQALPAEAPDIELEFERPEGS